MKILFLKEARTKSGFEGVAKNLAYRCGELQRQNIPYLVLYNQRDLYFEYCQEKHLNVRHFAFPASSPKALLRSNATKKEIQKVIDEEKITHIHVHNPYLLLFVDRSWKVPISCHMHGAFNEHETPSIFKESSWSLSGAKRVLSNLYKRMYAANTEKADLVINVSECARETSIRRYKSDAKKNIVIPNGIDMKIQDSPKEIPPRGTPIRIFCIGRITHAKGVEDFGEVAKSLKTRRPELEFTFVGPANNPAYENDIRQRYQAWVNFVGFQKDTESFLKEEHLFLFLTHREACPNVVIEGYHYGTPVIGWDTVGVNEIIENGKSGYLCQRGNYQEVANRIEQLVDNPQHYQTVSSYCLEKAKDYRIEKNVELFTRALEGIG